MDIRERKYVIAKLIDDMRVIWPPIVSELKDRKENMIDNLVAQNNEETRGRIKELNDLINLPATLYSELLAIDDALADTSRVYYGLSE